METIRLEPVDSVRITILMDNLTDPLLFPVQHIERTTWLHQLAPGWDAPRRPSPPTACPMR
jgi:hypothetical protein